MESTGPGFTGLVSVLALPLTRCVTLNKGIKLSAAQCPDWGRKDNDESGQSHEAATWQSLPSLSVLPPQLDPPT